MNARISWLSAALLVASCSQAPPPAEGHVASLPDGVTFVDAVEREPGDEVVIPYRRFKLANGLTVILHQDTSDPLVHVDVTYHVGSSREDVGKSGFAHFFEHMMFQGSENVGDEQHFKIVSESGGTLNGTTSTDRTNYFQTAPSNQLEKLLWLEADRMGFLLDAVTQEKFEVQRDTVKNERAQRVDNVPYGLLRERVGEAMYPEGHPYSWLTIGYVEDLDRVDVNDLKEFFLRWYGPNNAVLTIGGDFDEAETLAWVAKYYGPVPRGPDVAMPDKPSVTLDANRYISLEDNVALPLLYIGYPTVYLYHEDEAPLDVLMFILGQGETSLLYKNMVKNQIAVQAQATHGCQELSCQFAVLALPNPAAGKTLADLERIVRESLAEFEARGITDDDLLRTKMTIVSQKIYSLESVAGKVSQLAAYQYLTGNPDFAPRDVARYENVTKDDVMRVYEQYIKDKPAVIMSIVPHGQLALRASEDTWERYERSLPDYEKVAAEELDHRRAEDYFDRSVIPPAGANPATTLPDIWRGELENGIAVLGARNVETPTTSIRLRIAAAGQRNESVEQLGLAALTASMMNEASEKSSNEELSDRLQKLGSSVSFQAGNDDTVATVRSLTRNLDETLAILAEKLLQPKLAPEDFARVQAQTLQAIEQSKKQAASTAQVVYQQLLMGRDNPIAYLDMGTSATVAGLTVDDVRGFYAAHYSPKVATIVAVSDLGRDQLLPKLGVLKSWQGPEVAAAPLKPFPDTGGTRIFLVDKPNAVQSEIRIGKRALNYDATGEFYRAGLANFVLGDAFNSRINLNLREDKGYTYGARSRFAGEMDYGLFTARAGVRRDTTAASIIEFDREIRRYAKDGIRADELTFTRNAIGQRDALRYETPRQKLAFLSRIQTYGLADDFVDQQNAILRSITADELNAIAAKHLTMDDMVIVVVGDRSAIEKDLQALGHEIVHLDAGGNVLVEA
ncbi:MAG: pitrilysin family protein [Gammaproteobacteria bacterium]|nr:pitrilysin family protein [Gammaproteobacteria bacterium]